MYDLPLPKDRVFEAFVISGSDVCIKFVRYVSGAELKQRSIFDDGDDYCGAYMALDRFGDACDEISASDIRKWREMTLEL